MDNPFSSPLPPGQQLVAKEKWPIIGEREPAKAELLTGGWGLAVGGDVAKPKRWTLHDLLALPLTKKVIDIHCVTRWSKLGVVFEGVMLSDLMDWVAPRENARYVSFVSHSTRRHSSSMLLETALAQETLIALKADDQLLPREHGGPIRNIVPGRYFYKSVKWLAEIELREEDRLGFWESESGYHNAADPWQEQRYLSSTLDRRETAKLIEANDFSGKNLLGILAASRKLNGLNARQALLRNADFSRSDLTAADFCQANLSNANLQYANLQDCNLQGADLEGANLTGANLSGANLLESSLIGSSFFDPEIGESSGATFDRQTKLSEATIAPLFPEQLAFVERVCRPLGLIGR